MSRDYPRLDIVTFGRHLLETGDLDPVYIALHKMEMAEDQLHRWLIAYWCLYHCGAACYLSERPGKWFWEGLMQAAYNMDPAPAGGRWPRGHERRHFRGTQGIAAVRDMWDTYKECPEDMVRHIAHLPEISGQPKLPFRAVADRVQAHRGFGPWMAFKVADMADRVLGVPVDFSEADVFMFKDPKEAAIRLWRYNMNLPDTHRPKDEMAVIRGVVAWLQDLLGEHYAPPLNDRKINLQEIETVLCKWKSHQNGHYPLFNDIDEIRAGLESWWGACETAKLMSSCMPRGANP
jgi:hypothetical protein